MSKLYYERPNKSDSSQNRPKQQEQMQQRTYNPNPAVKYKGMNMKDLIMNVVLIVLSVLFVILFAVTIGIMADVDYSYTRDEDEFWYSIQSGMYGNLPEDYYHNVNENAKMTSGMEQVYAVARYFEAASLYKVAVHTQDPEKMEKYYAVMEENAPYMEDIPQIVEDIHEKLGLEISY